MAGELCASASTAPRTFSKTSSGVPSASICRRIPRCGSNPSAAESFDRIVGIVRGWLRDRRRARPRANRRSTNLRFGTSSAITRSSGILHSVEHVVERFGLRNGPRKAIEQAARASSPCRQDDREQCRQRLHPGRACRRSCSGQPRDRLGAALHRLRAAFRRSRDGQC